MADSHGSARIDSRNVLIGCVKWIQQQEYIDLEYLLLQINYLIIKIQNSHIFGSKKCAFLILSIPNWIVLLGLKEHAFLNWYNLLIIFFILC